MTTDDGPDYEALCEQCGEHPARRSDIEYRASHPDDPWMMLCDECDAKSGGRVPPRPSATPSSFKEELGPKASERRLEYLRYELRIDTALFLRLSDKPLPRQFQWLSRLSAATVRRMSDECYEVKMKSAAAMYGPRGYGILEEGLNRYRTICGTYQVMSGIGEFTGKKPAPPETPSTVEATA